MTNSLPTWLSLVITLCPSRHPLWTHDTRPIDFSLVVDNFGVKHVGKEHAVHLLQALYTLYTITEDSAGTLFSGLTIDRNYDDKYVDISMPNYIPNMLHKLQHATPTKHQGVPHAWTTPTYGAKVQYATKDDDSPILSAAKYWSRHGTHIRNPNIRQSLTQTRTQNLLDSKLGIGHPVMINAILIN
jgi:hypothetical protein